MPSKDRSRDHSHLRLVIDNPGLRCGFRRRHIRRRRVDVRPQFVAADAGRSLNLQNHGHGALSVPVDPSPDMALAFANELAEFCLSAGYLYGLFDGLVHHGVIAHDNRNTTNVVSLSTMNVVEIGNNGCSIFPSMKTLGEALRAARDEKDWSQHQLARLVEATQQQIAKVERGETLRPKNLPELNKALGVDLLASVKEGRLVHLAPAANAEPGSPVPSAKKDLPVYASAQGGSDGMLISYDAIEWVERPERLIGVPGAFAMYVVNDSMEPKYSQGDLLLIHPSRPVRKGDSVLCVKASDDTEYAALVKEFVRADSEKVVLKQYNPDRTFQISRKEIKGLHLVVGAYWGG